jgi:hypothetical protein
LDIQALGNIIADFTTANIDDAKGYLVDIDKILERDFQEFKDRADKAADDAKGKINNIIEQKIKYDADQAELEALRAKQLEDEIKAREKAAADAATKKANDDAQAAIDKAHADAQAAIDKANADKAKAEQDLADQKRRDDAEKKRLEDEKAAREADQENRKRVNNAAMAALIEHCQLSDEQAKAAIIAIAKSLITNVKIEY